MAATLKTTLIQEPSSATVNLTLNTDGTMTTATNMTVTGTAVMSSPYTMRNKIINGAMVIDQRNAGASTTVATSGYYSCDRWQCGITSASKFSIQQNAGSVTPPIGFSNYLGITSLSSYSVAAGDTFLISQNIEGFNIADLAWGGANAQTVTLSFWARSSLTGTFGGSLTNNDNTRSYPFSYTISSANTWTYITVTVLGDTSGTWQINNSTGIKIRFGLGSGSTFSGTAGAWVGSNIIQPTGNVSVVGTNGATFYITGVQLERGTVATPFEYRNYQQELAMCQRYYHRLTPQSNYAPLGLGRAYSTSAGNVSYYLPVSMRSNPTITYSSLSDIDIVPGGAATSLQNDAATLQAVKIGFSKTGLSSGGIYVMEFNTNLSAWLAFSSEL